MEVRAIKKEKNTLLVELKGDTKSFANLIREELWNDKNVSEAAAIKEHPYMVEPKVWVKTRGKADPKIALEKAAKRIKVKVEELKKEFQRSLKS